MSNFIKSQIKKDSPYSCYLTSGDDIISLQNVIYNIEHVDIIYVNGIIMLIELLDLIHLINLIYLTNLIKTIDILNIIRHIGFIH